MTKRKNIIYWIATAWLSLGMLSTGIVQLLHIPKETSFIINMGYPVYFLTLLGIWKLLGVMAVLVPKFPILKEWAYAGFFFCMSGAVFSHIASGHELKDLFGPILLLVLTIISWYYRPAGRKISSPVASPVSANAAHDVYLNKPTIQHA